jgi:hypothetical protein
MTKDEILNRISWLERDIEDFKSQIQSIEHLMGYVQEELDELNEKLKNIPNVP